MTGKPYRVEKLTRGHAWGRSAGHYLNSRVWREVGTVVAPDAELALKRAAYAFGSSQVRVSEDQEKGYL